MWDMMGEELNYFASFPEKLKALRGKHVALIGREVVASGDNAMERVRYSKLIIVTRRRIRIIGRY
jgi:hypothetical protein